jgi:hypothetical protein
MFFVDWKLGRSMGGNFTALHVPCPLPHAFINY